MRILFVAFPDSIHTVRWISQISDQGWDIHLFPSRDGLLHPGFKNITTYGFNYFRPGDIDPSVRWRQLWPRRGTSQLSILASRLGPNRITPKFLDRSVWLNRVIRKLQPDIIHSLEFQHAGYLTRAAKTLLVNKGFPPWAVTNWGSDLYLFGRLREHREKVRAVLSACDYYVCECHRDVELARRQGFKGEVMPVLPGAGGFDLEWMRQFRQPGPTSARRYVVLKGYQHWAGRALFGLRAIELCGDALQGYRVAIYLAGQDVALAAELLEQRIGVPVEIVGLHSAHEEILRLHGRARVSVGLSISDATSTSAIEAMVMGSFPIQSNTSCFDEWIEDGRTGILVHPEDVEGIAAALRRALSDDLLVDRANEENALTAAERLDRSVIQPQTVAMYQRMAGQSRT